MLRVLALLSVFVTLPALAQGYEAKYDMIWSVGIKLEAEAIETLKQTGDRFKMVLDATASLGSANETTNLLFSNENGWKPLDYNYTQSILGRTTGRNFRFNWNKKSLAWLHEPERAEITIPDDAVDPLGFRLQLAHMLRNGQALPETITMLDGNDIKARSVIPGELETLITPYGQIEAQKFTLKNDKSDPKRKFEFWLAPSLDYQLVKLEKRDKNRLFALTLKAFKKAGTP
jgi:hypothetical protein